MLRKFILVLLFLSSVSSEDIGSLFLGTSSVGGENEFYPRSYDVKYGTSAGFLIPIRFPYIETHYKVRASYHPVLSNRVYDDIEYEYISASNVLLVGKSFNVKSVSLLPQVGLGLLYEVIHHEWEYGHMYNLLFVDYSLKLNLPSIQERWGLLFNLEHGIDSSNPGYSPEIRFHVSLVFTY